MYSDFIALDFEFLDSGSDDSSQFFGNICTFAGIIGGAFELLVEDFLDYGFGAGRIKPLIFSGFELVGVDSLGHRSVSIIYIFSNIIET